MANKISVLIDVAVDRANRSLDSFKTKLHDAEGASGKLKVAAGGAFDYVKANAGELALAGGAALVAFGVKAVGAFQDTALAAGELRDKLGLTSEDASKFIEVAGDMNIEVADLESTIGRMNREIANAPGKFDAIGASIERNKDGTVNVRDTFLSVVDALNNMPDAAARAKAGQEIFGRSWQNISEMVMTGADDLSAALDGIEAGKIIDDAEVDRARRYRDALDALNGMVEELTIEVGGALVPKLTDAAEAFIAVKDAASDLAGLIPGPVVRGFQLLGEQIQRSLFWPILLNDLRKAAEGAGPAVGTLGESITEYAKAAAWATVEGEELAGASEGIAKELRDANPELQKFIKNVDDAASSMFDGEKSAIEFEQSIEDLRLKTLATTTIMNDAAVSDRDKAAALRELRLDQISAAEGAKDLAEAYAEEQGAAAGTVENGQFQIDKLNELRAKYPELGKEIDTYIATLLRIPGTVNTRVTASLPRIEINPRSGIPYPVAGGGIVVGATGGIVNRPTMALIGEAGPEAVVPLDKSPGNGPLPAGLGGATTINVTVNGADPQLVIDAIRKYVRWNGPLRGVT